MLLQQGAAVNAAKENGRTALIGACASGDEAVARLLLQHGALVNAKTDKGGTALIAACQDGHEAVARLLLQQNRQSIRSSCVESNSLTFIGE